MQQLEQDLQTQDYWHSEYQLEGVPEGLYSEGVQEDLCCHLEEEEETFLL